MSIKTTQSISVFLLASVISIVSAGEIEELKKQLNGLLLRYQGGHPEVIRLRKKIRQLRAKRAFSDDPGKGKADSGNDVAGIGRAEKSERKIPLGVDLNDDGKAILRWMESLPARKTKKILSGQYRWLENIEIFAETGKWPALYEDYLWQSRARWKNAEKHRDRMRRQWEAGGLVSVHMPIPNPKNRSSQMDRDMSLADLRAVSEEGTGINENYRDWLDTLAVHLQWLKDREITVFIRPFHEMTGDWFWYGSRNPGAFKRMFRYTVRYLKKEKGLDNIIVVFSSAKSGKPLAYYPGHRFVDVVGVDSYAEPPITKNVESIYRQFNDFGKPFALTELGWKPQKFTVGKGVKDSYRDIILAIKQKTPQAAWWLSWEAHNSPSSQLKLKDLYNDPWVITRDEVDWREYRKVNEEK